MDTRRRELGHQDLNEMLEEAARRLHGPGSWRSRAAALHGPSGLVPPACSDVQLMSTKWPWPGPAVPPAKARPGKLSTSGARPGLALPAPWFLGFLPRDSVRACAQQSAVLTFRELLLLLITEKLPYPIGGQFWVFAEKTCWPIFKTQPPSPCPPPRPSRVPGAFETPAL